jgi:hypothetical protein
MTAASSFARNRRVAARMIRAIDGGKDSRTLELRANNLPRGPSSDGQKDGLSLSERRQLFSRSA